MEKLSVPRGTMDVLPADWQAREHVLAVASRAFSTRGFGRIQTPTFEDTQLFVRGVGESTDVVGKEMYTFSDRSDRSLTLRPEGTAPVARAYVSEGMHRLPQPVKLWYFSPMFRYEAPQKGRYREHYQLGCEAFGSEHPAVDAEVIALLDGIYRELELVDVELNLNSIGDGECRPQHRELLVSFLRERSGELCEECRGRIDTNPLRAFDCKNEGCRAVMAQAPTILEHLCGPCREHFDAVRALLDAAGVAYRIDPTLVRGLDYYTRTTFEFRCARLGAQDGIGGGGRYDGLVEQLGGPSTPGVGFGSGVERVVLALHESGWQPPQERVELYACVPDEGQRAEVFRVVEELRREGMPVGMDLAGRSLKGQLKQASRLGAELVLIADPEEWRLQQVADRLEWKTSPSTVVAEIAKRVET